MKLDYPLKDKFVSDIPFGMDFTNDSIRSEFYTLFDNKHPGIDFDVPINTPVLNSFDGIVVRSEFHKGMGNTVGIRNGNIVALYAHLENISVKLGQIINTGDLIGYSGQTGSACPEPHLHFELRDLTKSTLKEMVFEPVFDEKLTNYQIEFYYIVNNKNTKKTINSLSKLFFGTDEGYRQNIKNRNNLELDFGEIIPDGFTIIVPNYR